MIVEALLLVVTIAGCAGATVSPILVKWLIVPIFLLFTWHVVVIPICIFYLVGRPIVMTLSPSWRPGSSEFMRTLRAREALNDDEFYARYYHALQIPIDTVACVRRALLEIDSDLDRAIPSDNLGLVDLDFIEGCCTPSNKN